MTSKHSRHTQDLGQAAISMSRYRVVGTCPVCGGDGTCHEQHHIRYPSHGSYGIVDVPCQECGGGVFAPGDCQHCYGTGEAIVDLDE